MVHTDTLMESMYITVVKVAQQACMCGTSHTQFVD